MQCQKCKYMERFEDGSYEHNGKTIIVYSGGNNYRCTKPIVSGMSITKSGDLVCDDFEKMEEECEA